MGLLNKLKNAVSSITGGGARVTVTADQPSREGPFKVKVKAVVADQPLQVNRVYVQLNGHETVVVHNVHHDNFVRDETEYCNTFDQEFNIAQAQTLKLRVSTIPIIDTAPMQAAIAKGFFAEQGLEVGSGESG